jgi:hypothetical protein
MPVPAGAAEVGTIDTTLAPVTVAIIRFSKSLADPVYPPLKSLSAKASAVRFEV